MADTTTTVILAGSAILDLVIQTGGFLLSWLLQTEKFYDALGCVTFLALALGSLGYAGSFYARQVLVTVLVCCWALRLGTFLLYRAIKLKGDSRFKDVMQKPFKLYTYWLLQALWVWATIVPLLLLNSRQDSNPGLRWSDVVGTAAWAVGMALEATADLQKLRWRLSANKRHPFCDVGLFSVSRYPQYFGEMVIWWGLWIVCTASFHGADWASVASPCFVCAVLLFISGIPLQEQQARQRWGSDPAYIEYRQRTRLLVPLPQVGCLSGRAQ